MEDQVNILFRLSQPNDMYQANRQSAEGHQQSPGGSSSTPPQGLGNLWDQVGLKYYNHYDYGLRESPPEEYSPSELQLVNILRLTVDCPLADVQAEARKLLKDLELKGFAVPRPIFTCPSSFIPPLKCPRVSISSRCSSSEGADGMTDGPVNNGAVDSLSQCDSGRNTTVIGDAPSTECSKYDKAQLAEKEDRIYNFNVAEESDDDSTNVIKLTLTGTEPEGIDSINQ